MFTLHLGRFRALELLEAFCSLGPWAVRTALSVGVFPYVFKLLGSPAQVRRLVVGEWTSMTHKMVSLVNTSQWVWAGGCGLTR